MRDKINLENKGACILVGRQKGVVNGLGSAAGTKENVRIRMCSQRLAAIGTGWEARPKGTPDFTFRVFFQFREILQLKILFEFRSSQ